jgi:predicted CoA-binding protein
MKKKTLVIGASAHANRYSYIAMQRLAAFGHPVLALGLRSAMVGMVPIETVPGNWKPVDTVTLYLNPERQKAYYNYLLDLRPNRIIFNPGTENRELEKMMEDAGVETLRACTLVMLSTGQY